MRPIILFWWVFPHIRFHRKRSMKIYFDPRPYRKEQRPFLADILRPYINNRSLEENISIYGAQITQYEVVSEAQTADLHVLTMTWDYYFQNNQLSEAEAFIERAQSMNKPVLIWQNSDFSVRFPKHGNVFLFQTSGHGSTRKPRQFSKPVFVGDPLQELNMPEIELRRKGSQPVIGFCGQADYTLDHVLSSWLRFGSFNVKSALRLSPYEFVPIRPLSTQLRWQVLHQLEKVPTLQTNFIKRKKYKAGARTSAEIKTSRREFWNNMLESDYVICVRGTGNFSARLYETLAMGRIPIFIDTDCILPYEKDIDWKQLCVWVDVNELELLPQKVLDFHKRLSEDDFIEHQKRCRAIWQERLSFPGFFQHFPEYFSTGQ
jgi:hypothetical protein